jgi:heterodisulfide reductase subunit A
MDRFVVLGAGVTGMTAAIELASLGAEVAVVEQSSIVGGHVTTSSYCCKATSSCSRCGVCIAHTQLNSSLLDPRIELLTGSAVERFAIAKDGVSVQIRQQQPAINYRACASCDACMEACPEQCITKYKRAEITQYMIDYTRCLRSRGESCTACSDACSFDAISGDKNESTTTIHATALLVATGHTPYDATKKARYGYGTSSRIMTGLEAEAALATGNHFGDPTERVALVQCVGSRDPSIGRNFCSGVCCAYALRIARMLKYRNPDMQVVVYYIDLQNFDRQFTSLLDEVKDLGVTFVRGLPFRIDEEADGSLAFTIETADGSAGKAYYDRAILSVGIDAREDADGLIQTIGLSSDENGFLVSNHPNVFTCGTCARPMSIPESMAAARETAHSMWTGSLG